MVDGDPPYPPGEDDDHDDLAALDLSVAVDVDEDSDLDAFDVYTPPEEATDTGDAWAASDPLAQEEEDDELQTPLFTVTNPPGTVSVTVLMDGRVQEIDLSAKVTTMTESDLADEVVVIAGLARQKARSAQYAFVLEGMREMGQDVVGTRDFLGRALDLPSPEEAQAEVAKVFATRYVGDHD